MAKFWNCRRVSSVTGEVIQSIGGNAYIEEHPCPRYYREAPLNAIWEGTSNMMVMDVGRVFTREPKAIEPVIDEVRSVASQLGTGWGPGYGPPAWCRLSVNHRLRQAQLSSGDRARTTYPSALWRSSPGPPNHPLSFCVPYPMNNPPMTTRRCLILVVASQRARPKR